MLLMVFGNDLYYLLIANDEPCFSVVDMLERSPYPFYRCLVKLHFINLLHIFRMNFGKAKKISFLSSITAL